MTEENHRIHSTPSLGSKWARTLGLVLGLVALSGGVLFMALPQLARGMLEAKLTELWTHDVTIAELQLNPFTGFIKIDGLLVRSRHTDSDLVVIRQASAYIELPALFRKNVSLKDLEIVSPVVHLVRTEAATWNLFGRDQPASSSNSNPETIVEIMDADLHDGVLIIEDRSIVPTRTERLDDIHITVHDLSTSSSAVATIHGSASTSDLGTITIDGGILPDLSSGTLKVELKALSLATYQKYISSHWHVKGQVEADLTVRWPGAGESSVQVSGALAGQNIEIASANRPMVHAATIHALHVDISWPDIVSMDRLVLNKPEIWIRRNENGRFVGLAQGDGSPPSPRRSWSKGMESKAKTTSTQWLIDKVVVQGGTAHLEDRFVTPGYSDSLHNLEMTVEHFVSRPNHAVTIAGRTEVASGGSLDLHGQATLFGPMPSASLKATIHRLAVPAANSYLARMVAHHSTHGRLTTTVDITLANARLDVVSDVILSDLQVEPVLNSTRHIVQERIGLPLSLLVQLLKDEDGRIVITFPFSGPVTNPAFDWTHAVWATIRNAVVKLIAFPIHSIGNLLAGDDQVTTVMLDPITFRPGSSKLGADMERTLQHLVKFLASTDYIVLHIAPILSSTDLEALQRLPRESWPVAEVDTPETARHLLAVRRAYIVAAHLARLGRLSAVRIPVDSPLVDTSEAGTPRVELQLEKADRASTIGHASSRKAG